MGSTSLATDLFLKRTVSPLDLEIASLRAAFVFSLLLAQAIQIAQVLLSKS